tara:strand:- start:2616 stop:3866 length:1251 start_codon:yes stop_codon:yes gene_type:complete
MACPDNGTISIQSLVDEFGGSAPHSMSEYYRNGSYVPGNNTNIPESGTFSLSNCYSAVNEIQHTHSNGDTHANYATIFGSNWASTVPKRVIVPSGVTVGGTSTHAMNVPSGMGGTLVFDISGNVYGHGGSANGGTGGNAIHCTHTSGVTININSGANVKSGGGGGGRGGQGGTGGNGGQGGTGGQGKQEIQLGTAPYWGCTSRWDGTDVSTYSSWAYGHKLQDCRYRGMTPWLTGTTHLGNQFINGLSYTGWCWYWQCMSWQYNNGGAGGAGGSSGGAGGAGGNGGVGQGYNQSASNGSGGSGGSSGGSGSSGSSGGTNAGNGGQGGSRGQGGTGGTGGNGGSFGNSGSNGNSGSTGSTGGSGSSGSNGNHTNGSGGSSGSGGSGGSSGSSGGLAGYYIYNRSSITLNNSGSVAGR